MSAQLLWTPSAARRAAAQLTTSREHAQRRSGRPLLANPESLAALTRLELR